jgi:hypothetical protein
MDDGVGNAARIKGGQRGAQPPANASKNPRSPNLLAL